MVSHFREFIMLFGVVDDDMCGFIGAAIGALSRSVMSSSSF